MDKMTIVLTVFFLSSFFPSVYAADNIEITYMHEEPSYWYGKGVLSSEIDGDEFVLDTDRVTIVGFDTNFVPINDVSGTFKIPIEKKNIDEDIPLC
jgi:hypothetical protein